ncbi:MAG: cysteine synthase family protein [Erysipelotrichaceae bacterium]|nr:cysteine synthase family protein [Erysipelotrichaceae bacterium]MCI9523767.1 cysteine synthase family protein [Erysipelotrichaceae bacterium]
MNETIKLIGNTPIIKIEHTNIYVKLEKYNPGGSIKDRAVYGMLKDAFANERITKQTKLIEATSGNTGIALAMMGAIYDIPVTIVMPDTMSEERRNLIRAYGAELILSDGSKGMQGAVDAMQAMMKQDSAYLQLGQFDNLANVRIHYETSGPEIYRQVPDIDLFVCCAGTGGTFSGISKYLKEQNPNIRCVIGEPTNSALLSGHPAGAHKIQGIGANFVPSILDTSLIDDILWIDDEDAFRETVAFAKSTGILVGISSGANIALAKRLSQYYPEDTIVTVAPDGGEKYLSVLEFS